MNKILQVISVQRSRVTNSAQQCCVLKYSTVRLVFFSNFDQVLEVVDIYQMRSEAKLCQCEVDTRKQS